MRHPFIDLCGAVTLCILSASHGFAAPYDAIYSFGDSLTDEGNTLALGRSGRVPGLLAQPLPPYYEGRSSNGPVWIEYLSQELGLPAPVASLLGGTNFAYAGGETGTTPLHVGSPLDLLGTSGQLAQFKSVVPIPSSNALYTVWIGANDLYENFYALGAGNIVNTTINADTAARNAAMFVRGLADAGARNIFLITVPDLGLSPIITQSYPAYAQEASALSRLYNSELIGLVSEIAKQYSVNLSVLDTYALLDQTAQDPSRFGLKDVSSPCWTGNFVGEDGTICDSPATHLFWDHYHPTTAAHEQIALQALATVTNVPEPESVKILSAVALIGIWIRRRSTCARQ